MQSKRILSFAPDTGWMVVLATETGAPKGGESESRNRR